VLGGSERESGRALGRSLIIERNGEPGHRRINSLSTLYVFSGLPGAGKTVLSRKLASHFGVAYLRIDTIEQALRDICSINVQGYRLAYRIAADNLRLGVSVVADSCNPIELTRDEWEEVARQSQALHINIEIICSDRKEHRERIGLRKPTVPGLALPGWDEVLAREYHTWTRERIVIDTSGKTKSQSFDELLSKLGHQKLNNPPEPTQR
jgi:predicted kinase